MTKTEYLRLRDNSYKFVGVLGTRAETEADENISTMLSGAYQDGCLMLDSIDEIGYKLGFIHPETNEVL